MLKFFLTITGIISSLFATIINIPVDYATIQGGINGAENGDTVLVQAGTYAESINFIGKNIIIMSEEGLESAIIQGDNTQRVVTFESSEGPGAMLIGFCIENGNGGIICSGNSNPIIFQCKIRNNNSTIPSDASFSLAGGGGIAIINSAPLLMNTAIYQNESSLMGGGIYMNYSTAVLANSIVYGNQGISIDGVIYLNSPNSVILNSIIWENNIGPSSNNPINILYSDIQGGWTGESNLNEQPQFVNTENGDFHLLPESPCINAGQPSFLFNDNDGTSNDIGSFGGSGFFIGMGGIDIGQVVIQSYSTYPLKIYNLMGLPLSISNLAFSNPDCWSTNIAFPFSLDLSDVSELPITFIPQMIGLDTCDLTFQFTDGINADNLSIVAEAEGIPSFGHREFRKKGQLDAGLVATIFKNYSEITDYPNQPSCEWPKGSGHSYMDGIAFMVQAEIEDISGNIIHPLETQYREFVDMSPEGEPWGWEPLPGYFNPLSSSIAMSTNPDSWPTHWPNKDSAWDGYWNGFFGRGVVHADQETYFMIDDYQDQEWDYNPVETDPSRGGLGLQVEVRGYAWNNTQFEDLLIWHYAVHNISDFDYQQVVLGLYMDTGVGGTEDGADDLGTFLPEEKLVYFNDIDGIGGGGWSPVGYVGIKFLEMPGNHSDGTDNDSDGLVDESRDNGIDDDLDWNQLVDDVGNDGIAGTNDTGEGDGFPSHGEPNFDKTDQDESDAVDINTVRFFPVHSYELHDDEQNWEIFTSGEKQSNSGDIGNLGSFVISEAFPLSSGETTYFSFAIVFGEDLEDMLSNTGSISPSRLVDDFYPGQVHTANLQPNFPNPFNPTTTIQYSLSEAEQVKLKIFDILGQEVMTLQDAKKAPGNYEVQWNGLDQSGNPLSTGVYFCRLEAGSYNRTIKMVYLR
ncbi:MAG: T9SS type A sorting domain-containing protein [Candidatus Marinimicrobia bacterium]|nr:T9SS type A sorting domain-containing protein [FCB group bacterium]MBL7024189.1 T9SS type A sorting domain-containing protein [Candidatus Neomarinimicrobiota bacterium]